MRGAWLGRWLSPPSPRIGAPRARSTHISHPRVPRCAAQRPGAAGYAYRYGVGPSHRTAHRVWASTGSSLTKPHPAAGPGALHPRPSCRARKCPTPHAERRPSHGPQVPHPSNTRAMCTDRIPRRYRPVRAASVAARMHSARQASMAAACCSACAARVARFSPGYNVACRSSLART